jgi:hypothetical protein
MKHLLLFVCFYTLALAGYGDETSGSPVWQERAAHAVTNLVRSGNPYIEV